MKRSAVWGVLTQTFRESIRAKWLFMFAVVFFLLAINVPSLVLTALAELPKTFLVNYLVFFVSLSFQFVPLLPLPLGAMSIVDERESGALQYILSTPVTRAQFLVGRILGLLLATSVVVVGGYGLAAVVSYNVRLEQYPLLGSVLVVALTLNGIMLGLALLISTLCSRKATALAIAIFLWFTFTVLSSFGSLSVVLSINGGAYAMVPLILLNPVESSRLLALLHLNAGYTELGGTGILIKYGLGDQAVPALLISLVTWGVVSFLSVFLVFRRQDMT